MTKEMQFKKIVAQYCEVKPEEMTDDMRFREDLGFSSLDFMSFLGELEDTFDIELEEVQFTSNEEMLAQVWLNLISNAIKFSREGGDIRVYCGRMGKNVRVEIEDHGVGMDAETKKHIFEQFYQGAGSRATAGNGLGLTIA